VFTIVVICTGNVARSPMAEAMLVRGLRQRLKDGAEDLAVSSAGTLGLIGQPMAAPARRLLGAVPAGTGFAGCDLLPGGRHHGMLPPGGDDFEAYLDAFRARRLEPDLLAGADLVLGATREHRSAAVGMAPHLVRRTFTLVELARLAGSAAHAVLADWDPEAGIGIEPPPADRARAVVARAGELRAMVRALHAADDDIEDPYGRDDVVYRRVAERIGTSVELILDGLVGR
jgi:protein-tyrosine phosphatase